MSAIATKSRRNGKYRSYRDVRNLVHGIPLEKRREIAIGRNGAKVQPRKYDMDNDEIAQLKAQYEKTGEKTVIANAYNKGAYHYLVLALATLGFDEKHTKASVFKKMETLMSAKDTIKGEGKDQATAWERFTNKEPRGDNALDTDGRLDQNVVVMQRLTGMSPYALKLMQACQKVLGKHGGVIDVLVDNGREYLRLNTKARVPINQTKKRGIGSPAAIAAEKAASKAAAAGRKARKTSKATTKTKATPKDEPVVETVATAE